MADNPTRRLDAPLSNQPCPKCGQERVLSAVTYGGQDSDFVRFQRRIRHTLIFDEFGSSDCAALVCTSCGYAELYAMAPHELRDKPP